MIRNIHFRGREFRVGEGDQSFVHRLSKAAIAFGSTLFNERFWHRYERGKWEARTFDIFDRFLNDRHSYIDIGAWIGPTVLYASQLAAHTYAIEPDPSAFSILRSNIDLNPRLKGRISLFRGAIYPESGTIVLGARSSFGDSMSSIHFSRSSQAITVDALSLEDFMGKFSVSNCNFIKMDIEGGETVVLPSIKGFLKSQKPTLLVSLHPRWFPDLTKDSEAILDALFVYSHVSDNKGNEMTPQNIRRRLRSRFVQDIVATRLD